MAALNHDSEAYHRTLGGVADSRFQVEGEEDKGYRKRLENLPFVSIGNILGGAQGYTKEAFRAKVGAGKREKEREEAFYRMCDEA